MTKEIHRIVGGARGISRRGIIAGGAISMAGLAAAALTACTAGNAAATSAAPTAAAGVKAGTEPTLTGIVYSDAEFDAQLLRALDTIPYGGADFGEALITARTITEGDKDAWFTHWQALADRIMADAEKSLAAGREVSAQDGFLRASTYYRTSGVFMYAPPMQERFVTANAQQRDAFRRASELMPHPFREVKIPYEDTELDGYFATPAGSGPFPTLIIVDGYDGTMEETYFGGAVAALRRGYAVLLMDGPGQGAALVEKHLYFRPDWEAVVTPEVDWLVARPEVDSAKIVLMGRSWGGYLAPRAATAEHRLAAVIADAPQYSPAANAAALLPEEYRGELSAAEVEKLNGVLRDMMAGSPALDFSLNRGMLTHGNATPAEYLLEYKPYTLEGIAQQITCPVLLTSGENDPRNGDAKKMYDALTAPKTLIVFTNAEGGGEHDEAGAAVLFSQRAFDWLDTAIGR